MNLYGKIDRSLHIYISGIVFHFDLIPYSLNQKFLLLCGKCYIL